MQIYNVSELLLIHLENVCMHNEYATQHFKKRVIQAECLESQLLGKKQLLSRECKQLEWRLQMNHFVSIRYSPNTNEGQKK